MPFFLLSCSDARRHVLVGTVSAGIGLLAGCTTPSTAPTIDSEPTPVLAAPTLPFDPTLVVRYGRYTLAELTPDSAQDDLMHQVVDITFPATVIASVGDALRYLLLRSGYELSGDCAAAIALDALPLPAGHLHLGPLTLRSALHVLVGPAWQLQVDDASRRICFTRGTDPVPVQPASSSAVGGDPIETATPTISPAASERRP